MAGLNVSRRKEPGGNYVAVMDRETYERLKSTISKLGLDVEVTGNIAIVKDKSWNHMRRLMNTARELGINVNED